MRAAIFFLALLITLTGCSRKQEPAPVPPPAPEKPAAKPPPAAEKPPAELPEGKPTAFASTGEGDYKPEFAMDGDLSTRWGSNFGDNEWIIFDLGKTQEIAGARIDWETAYGKDYDIQLSMDKNKWTNAISVREGDGGADELFFKPAKARFVKLKGLRRGTGWGYSIWEFKALQAGDLPLLVGSSTVKGKEPARALDGDTATAWQPEPGKPADLKIDFKNVRQFGGLEIHWAGAPPAKYAVHASKDGEQWTEACRVDETDGGRDVVFFPSATARMLKIEFEAPAGKDSSIAELLFKGSDEEMTLARKFEALASRLPDGSLPRWLKRTQTFWTITGVEGDTEETLLGEEGTIEPFKDSFCVMPFLKIDGKVRAAGDFARKHTLEDGGLPLPQVSLKAPDVEWSVGTVSYGKAGESVTAARYRVTNPGKRPLKAQLNLVVWPLQLNPPWQYGGPAPIREAKLDTDQTLWINKKKAIVPVSPPTTSAAGAFKDGIAYGWMKTGNVPKLQGATDADGAATALYQFDLEIEPGASKDVVVLFPLHERSPVETVKEDAGAFYQKLFEEQRAHWKQALGQWKLVSPHPSLEHFVRANLAYMLLNRDLAAAQPGPRNYSKAWMRDGAVSTATYLRFGFNDVATEYLEWYTPLIREDGWAPFLLETKTGKPPEWCKDWKEYDSQGEYVYAVRKHFDFVKDKAFIEKLFPEVESVMAYQTARLEERRTPKHENTKFFGILPESNSHEGYFPGVHSYWDDFWGLRGYGDAADLADAIGKPDKAKALRAEQARFRADLHASMKKTMEMGNQKFIPGCAEKCDFDPTSTSIGLTAANELPHLLADETLAKALKFSYDKYVRDLRPRYEKGKVWGSFTPYEARNIEALVKLGRREDALKLFEFLIGPSARPQGWNLLAEVVHYEPSTGSYIGDMPHTWVGADLVNAARSFFLMDDGPQIELAAGVPAAWLEQGKLVAVENLPTTHGKLSYKIQRASPNEVILEADGQAAPPEGFVFRHPFGSAVKSATVDGQETTVAPDAVRFQKLPAKVTLVLAQ